MIPLPIDPHIDAIMGALRAHPVVIVRAETGAGKSTRIPRRLLDDGLRCLVTQPRRLAARTVAERVADELGEPLGGRVGFRTARERQESARTSCLFVTEGLALVRELLGAQRAYDVLVLDEVHEWSRDMEVLVAWARRELRGGASFRLVIMSATMEAEQLAAYFGDAPVFSIPGRTYPVTTRDHAPHGHQQEPWTAMARDVAALVGEGRNVLVFAPGKGEIEDLCQRCSALDAEVIPLHGGLDRAEQARAFRRYGRPKVVIATNVAQTSITIEDVDAVVDSGLERRTEVHAGVEGIFLRPTSLADGNQRAGRAGRTRPGIYIDHAAEVQRLDFPVPEIRRIRLDQAVLRLAMAELDLEELELFHAVETAEVHSAKETLRALGCLGEGITVTEIGQRVSRLPTSVRAGRMLIEAEARGVLAEVITIAAILESGGIVDGKATDETTRVPIWRRHVADPLSDHVTFLRLYEQAERAGRGAWRSLGLHGKGMSDAQATRRGIAEAATRTLKSGVVRGTRDDIVKSVATGLVDQLRAATTNRWGEPAYGADSRKLAKESSIDAARAPWVVGEPFDIQGSKGPVRLLRMVSAVDPAWLAELAPAMVTTEVSDPQYVAATDQTTAQVVIRFRGLAIQSARAPHAAPEALVRWLVRCIGGSEHLDAALSDEHSTAILGARHALLAMKKVNDRAGTTRHAIAAPEAIHGWLAERVGHACRLADIAHETLRLEGPPDTETAAVLAAHPDAIMVCGVACPVAYGASSASIAMPTGVSVFDLPDALQTPGGRPVALIRREGWDDKAWTDLRSLKHSEGGKAAAAQFAAWARPDVGGDEIIETVYGELAGLGLVAYGVRGAQWTAWSTSREEAEAALNAGLRHRIGELVDYGDPLRDRVCRALTESHTLASLRALFASTTAEMERAAAAKAAAAVRDSAEEVDALAVFARGDASPWGPIEANERMARTAVRFVRAAMVDRDPRAVAQILTLEAGEQYGRARRAASIAVHFPGAQEAAGVAPDWQSGADVRTIAAWARAVAAKAPRGGVRAEGRRPLTAAPVAVAPLGATLGDLMGRFGKPRR